MLHRVISYPQFRVFVMVHAKTAQFTLSNFHSSMRELLVLTTFSVEHSFYHLYSIRSSSVLGVSLMFPRGWQLPYRSRKLVLGMRVEHTFKWFSSSEGLTSSTVLSTRIPPIIRKHFLVGSTFLKASSTSLRS
jgi:hypothetical protein